MKSSNKRKLRGSSLHFRNDKNFVLPVVKEFGTELRWASERLKDDIDVVRSACEQNGQALEYASENLRSDKDFVSEVCRVHGYALQYAAPLLQDDKDVVSIACQSGKRALRYASPRLKNDKEVVLIAVQCFKLDALHYASDEFLQDRDCLIAAGIWEENYHSPERWMERLRRRGGLFLRFASTEVKKDKKLVCFACELNGLALRHASETLRDDEDIAMIACRQNGKALRFVSDRLRDKKPIVQEACKQTFKAIEYASKNLQNDKDIILIVCEMNWKQLKNVPEQFQDDKDVVLTACRNNGEAIMHASERLRADKEIVMVCVSHDGHLLKYALGGLNQDPDCLVAAGIWDKLHLDNHDDDSSFNVTKEIHENTNKRRIVLSTRFSLDPGSQSQATHFTTMLKNHEYLQSDQFIVYSPNAFDKSTCDPEWTRFDWPCRGTHSSCQMEDVSLKTGVPQDGSCWRYSFRYQLENAKRTNGFMIQLAEAAAEFVRNETDQCLGDGQKIETEMAADLQVKVFRVHAPITNSRSSRGNFLVEVDFTKEDIDKVISSIKNWYEGGCTDMSECNITYTGSFRSKKNYSVRTKRLSLAIYPERPQDKWSTT